MTSRVDEAKRKRRAVWGRALRADDVDFVRASIAEIASQDELFTLAEIAIDVGSLNSGRFLMEDCEVGLQPGAPEMLLSVAAGAGQLECVRYVLQFGVRDLYEELPLVKSAMSGNIEVVELLLAAGADPNQGNPGFENALDVAIKDGFDEIADLLRQHGAEPGLCVYPSKKASRGEGEK